MNIFQAVREGRSVLIRTGEHLWGLSRTGPPCEFAGLRRFRIAKKMSRLPWFRSGKRPQPATWFDDPSRSRRL